MFILWHGFGFLVAVFYFVSLIISGGLFALFGINDVGDGRVVAVSLLLAALPCWIVGRRLLHHIVAARTPTGEIVRVVQPYHALFFIPMHWYGVIFGLFGLVAFVFNFAPHQARSQPLSGNSNQIISPSASDTPTSHRVVGGALKYSLLVPAAWTVHREQNNFDVVAMKSSDAWVAVYALPAVQADTQRWADILRRKFPGVSGPPASGSTVSVDNRDWAILDGHLTDEDGTRMTCRVYAYAEKGSAYAIMISGTSAAWASSSAELIRVAESFRFPR
jgi:hypothetical protein